jgi:transcription antitermination factor NusG
MVSFSPVSWHVLYLHPRCEKKVAEYCRVNKLDYYLPLRRQTRIYQRRRVTFEKPVFPGYLFASFDSDGRLAVLKSNNVVRILEPLNEDRLLFELEQIKKALMVDPTLIPCESLKTGKRVRILSGPFMGIEGVVQDIKGTAKVRLNVEMIGQAVSVEVEKDFLELVE